MLKTNELSFLQHYLLYQQNKGQILKPRSTNSTAYHISTQCHNTQDLDLNHHLCGNLKSCNRTNNFL